MNIILKDDSKQLEEAQFLSTGIQYTVYGIIFYQNKLLYYICDRVYNDFPIAKTSDLFEILDARLSRFWIFGFLEGYERYPVWMFPEWINEPYFQDKITDWEEREVQIFQAYREAMDLEFPNSFISEKAQIGNDEWLICPICIDAWESKTCIDGMVRCANCRKVLHNPRYKNEYPYPPFMNSSITSS